MVVTAVSHSFAVRHLLEYNGAVQSGLKVPGRIVQADLTRAMGGAIAGQ